MVKREWLQTYTPETLPAAFELIFQSWDSANKVTELSDYSVCTTWGLKNKKVYLLHVLRRRMDYPELKRQVREQAAVHKAKVILIEDKASGTQLIQELIQEGVYGVTRCVPKGEKEMRMSLATSTMENGMMYVPEKAPWLEIYLHELVTFPRGKFNDQVDSTSQALEWLKGRSHLMSGVYVWARWESRKALVELGQWDQVRAMDEKYGPPPGLEPRSTASFTSPGFGFRRR